MMKKYIWERSGWPFLTWDNKELSPLLGEIRNRQGQLLGKMSAVGGEIKQKALMETAISEILSSAEIEGKPLDKMAVNEEIEPYFSSKKNKTGDAVSVFFDVQQNCMQSITDKRLVKWYASYEGKPELENAGAAWKKPDLVIHIPSGSVERKMEYLKISIPEKIDYEMDSFLKWLNIQHSTDPVIKAGIACLRFLIIRPFEYNNGLISRNLANIFLTRADRISERYYSLSTQLLKNKQSYFEALTSVQTSDLDVTEWLRWFLYSVGGAIDAANEKLLRVINNSKFLDRFNLVSFNDRQLKIIHFLLEGDEETITTSRCAVMNDCSPDTALRDIQDLVAKEALKKENLGGRSTAYGINSEV
ncbi:MAG: DUF4172 domain-containing protein [Tannerella sp.]|jgi:Fic family protein|nr:DUF4172 domain-containing protein [Tannerella sp.]